jgi:hypothetical protein
VFVVKRLCECVRLAVAGFLVPLLQLLSWSPCHTVTLLNEFEWFQVVWPLVETGADMSDRLVPTVVSSVVIPRLCAFVRNGWDPFSRKQSKTLCDNINEVLTVEPSGDAIQVGFTS